MTLHYFAYGSNLHPVRLRERVPSSVIVGPGVLQGYALRFHKRGRDGSAKCDIVPEEGAEVHGALYAVDPRELPRLDAAERGYERVCVRAARAAGTIEVTTYRARPESIASGLLPYRWYRALVVVGARHHRLPAAYSDAIEAGPSWDDPDPRRARAMGELLARLRAFAD